MTSEDEGGSHVPDPEGVEEEKESGLQAYQARQDQIPPPDALPTSQSDGGVQVLCFSMLCDFMQLSVAGISTR